MTRKEGQARKAYYIARFVDTALNVDLGPPTAENLVALVGAHFGSSISTKLAVRIINEQNERYFKV